MVNNISNRIFFVAIVLGFLLRPVFADDEHDKVHAIHFYAKKYYRKGKYEGAIRAYEKILKILPNHDESQKIISICRQKIALTEDSVKAALDWYKKGDLIKASNALESAYKIDSHNYKVRSLLSKIFAELGIGYSIVGRINVAQNYLYKAQKLSPDDESIDKLIEINNRLVLPKTGNKDAASKQLKKMLATFEEYQIKQVQIIKESNETKSKIQELLHSSVREKRRLLNLMKDREAKLNEIVENQKKNRLSVVVNKYVLLAVGIILIFGMIIAAKYFIKFRGVISFKKKRKKLEIIKSSLYSNLQNEKQFTLNIIKQFLEDKDYRIKLKAITILHEVDPMAAIDYLKNIITNEGGAPRTEALRLLQGLKSADSTELLFQLANIDDDEIKRNVVRSLTEVLKINGISSSLESRIKVTLDEIYSQEEWIKE